MTVRAPVPRYIDFNTIYPYISNSINVSYPVRPALPDSGTIAQYTIEEQIAVAESKVELDLGTFYHTPFETINGQDWTFLNNDTYDYLYNLFIQRSIYQIYRFYYGTTGENKGDDFWTSALSDYNELLKRAYKLDQTDNYLYPLFTDMKLNPVGMKRILGPSNIGLLGGFATCNAAYAIRNGNKPRFNWG